MDKPINSNVNEIFRIESLLFVFKENEYTTAIEAQFNI